MSQGTSQGACIGSPTVRVECVGRDKNGDRRWTGYLLSHVSVGVCAEFHALRIQFFGRDDSMIQFCQRGDRLGLPMDVARTSLL